MKRTGLILCAIVIIPLILFVGCVDDTPAQSPFVTQIAEVKAQATANEKAIGELGTALGNKANAADVVKKSDIDIAVTKANEAKATADAQAAKITQLENDVKALKEQLAANPTGNTNTNTNTNTGAVGEITYTIQNQPSLGLWQFTTVQNVSVRIFNNKPESRYIRPQITLTSYQNQINAISANPTIAVISNSQGQAPVVFTATIIPTPAGTFPGTPTDNSIQVLFLSSSGGVSNGQYLMGSGTQMDLLISITVPSSPGLWNVTVSGSDIALN